MKHFKTLVLSAVALLSGATALRTAAQDGYKINYCGDLSTWVATGTENYDLRAYLYITPDMATRLDGNLLTDISFSTCLESAPEGTLPGSVFVSEDLEREPVVEVPVAVVSSATDVPEPQLVKLTAPYSIKAGQGFYFGYTIKGCGIDDYPLGIGHNDVGFMAGYADVIVDGEVVSHINMQQNACNLFLTATTTGAKRQMNDMAIVSAMKLPQYTLPVYVSGGTQPKVSLTLSNVGDNNITDIDYALYLNDMAVEPSNLQLTIRTGSDVTCSMVSPKFMEGRNRITMKISAVNGVECHSEGSVDCFMLKEADLVTRQFVVEKATGIWCAYCPMGIVAFEEMEGMYPDTFMAIDLHYNDPLQVDDTYNWMFEFSGGSLPKAIINRDPRYIVSPSTGVLDMHYKQWQSACRGVASIDLEARHNPENGSISVTASPKFAFSEHDADYSLAFCLMENGLVFPQTNGYSGSPGAPGNWGQLGNPALWTYTHTLRAITGCKGIAESVPTEIEKDTPYPYATEISTDVLKEINNSYILALLIDNRTGVILNGARIDAAQYAGVQEVVCDAASSCPVEYFDLQGRRIDCPVRGLYIRRQGTSVSKVIGR